MSGTNAKPWQFSLRGLFGLTTAFALAAVVAAQLGVGTLVMSTGLILIGLNARGVLGFMQTSWARPRILYPVWLLFFASFFMPAAKGCNNSVVVGWGAAAETVKSQAESVRKTVTEPESRKEILQRPLHFFFGHLWFGLVNLSNALMALLPLWDYQWRHGRGRVVSFLLLLGAVSAWLFPWGDQPLDDLLYGYYVWCGCITVMAMTCPLSWRVSHFAFGLAAIFVILHQSGGF